MTCDWGGCDEPATTVLRFRGQPGHVHDCDPHTAFCREFCDVIWSAPMPCPLEHNDLSWYVAPRGLA